MVRFCAFMVLKEDTTSIVVNTLFAQYSCNINEYQLWWLSYYSWVTVFLGRVVLGIVVLKLVGSCRWNCSLSKLLTILKFLHRAPVCGPHEASACFHHCQFGRLLKHANHGWVLITAIFAWVLGLYPSITLQRELDLVLAILVAGW